MYRSALTAALIAIPTVLWAQTPTTHGSTDVETYQIRVCIALPFEAMPPETQRRHAMMWKLLTAAGNQPDCRSCYEGEKQSHVCYAPRTAAKQ